MPRIRPIELQAEVGNAAIAPKADPDRIGFGRELAQLGAGVQGLGDAIKKNNEQKDISNSSAKLSEAYAKEKARFFNEAQAGTLDTDAFLSKFDENIGKASEGVTTSAGREYVKQQTVKMRANFLEDGLITQAKINGERTRNNEIQLFNNYSNASYNDPNSYELNKDLYFSAVDKMVETGNLPFEAALKLKSTRQNAMAKNALEGMLSRDDAGSDRAINELKSGKWDAEINADDKDTLITRAESAKNSRRVQADTNRANFERLKKEKAEESKLTFLTDITKGNVNGITDRILKDPWMDAAAKEHYINQLDANSKKALKTDPAAFNAIFHKIRTKEITTTEQIDARVGNGLDFEDSRKLIGYLSGKNTPQGKMEDAAISQLMKIANGELRNSDFNIADPEGDKNVYAFQQYMFSEIQKRKEAGQPVDDLFDRKSANFLGRDLRARFGRPMDEVIQSKTNITKFERTPEQERKPGEPIEEYVKRMKEVKGVK